ncbi:MAG: primosomal protein N' [Bacteroidetes bacterium]|nr:MAG: primosomal protein N' [Bacteroidota bacterium]
MSLHSTDTAALYADVLFPLGTPKPYTYHIPESLVREVRFGVRVEVQLGHKTYAAIVLKIHNQKPADYETKAILSVIDTEPIINENQVKLWTWIADYYCCTPGEVMDVALPANLKLAGERRIRLSPVFDLMDNAEELTDKEYLLAEALTIQSEITIEEAKKILGQKTVMPLIQRLIEKKVVYLFDDLKNKYKPKKISILRLGEPWFSEPERLPEAFELCSRAASQTAALMAFIELSRKHREVKKSELMTRANVGSEVIRALVKKGILVQEEKEISRLGRFGDPLEDAHQLTPQQIETLEAIGKAFESQKTVLLHGVTGSGKTRVYIELIKEAIARGEQVLYLLPEVALTAQIVARLKKVFGDAIAVYHHRVPNNERVDMWRAVLNGKPVILGARSSMFLPFQKLGLVVVDESHDPSYKQSDPAPRYHGRDAAIFLAHLHGAKVVLGTATPSIESYFNVQKGKYVIVEMPDRFGGIEMPEIVVADAKEEAKKKTLQSHFTSVLLEALKTALANGEQAILFKNRRGYSPTLRCNDCGWHSECKNCDVSLTYHKFRHNLLCHYCGYQAPVFKNCPACGSAELSLKGFGTEKIEDELKIYLPEARIQRMDYDTVRSRNAAAKIINDFEEKRIDILVGTQMVTKGLDFENVGIVGVVSADQLLQFPDFRATERAFQLMTQVAGRAGRKGKRGKVIIQAYNVAHPVLREVIDYDFEAFYAREIMERQAFGYPPFSRLIKITLKHKVPKTVNEGATCFARLLVQALGERVVGPAIPHVGRVRNQYLLDILIKMEINPAIWKKAKAAIRQATIETRKQEGLAGIRINVDVDPV